MATTSPLLKEVLLSVGVVLAVASAWALATQFAKSTLNLDPKHFYAPYSLVWFSTDFMVFCYPVYYLLYDGCYNRKTLRESFTDSAQIFKDAKRERPLWRSFFVKELPFVALWIAANYTYAQSLGHIAASAATAIMSSNIVMVWLFGMLLLKDNFSLARLTAVVLSVAGVMLISCDKEFADSLIGIGLVVFSALTAALYKVLFKRVNGNATLGQVALFMSGLGVINLTVNCIPMAALVLTRVDHIEVNYIPWAPLLASCLLNLLFNFLINFGIALLNPLTVSVGMLCGIPLSTAIDIFFRHIAATPLFLSGSSLIVLSFLLVTIPMGGIVKSSCFTPTNIQAQPPSELFAIPNSRAK